MYTIYQILPGDTLEIIADKFGTTIDMIEKINSLSTNSLMPGMSIVVPKNDSSLTYYIVSPGDTIYSIARKNNVSPNILLAINGLEENDYIYPNQQLLIPKENINVYVTQENDTFSSIGEKLNVMADVLFRQNERLYLLPDQLVIYKKEKNY